MATGVLGLRVSVWVMRLNGWRGLEGRRYRGSDVTNGRKGTYGESVRSDTSKRSEQGLIVSGGRDGHWSAG